MKRITTTILLTLAMVLGAYAISQAASTSNDSSAQPSSSSSEAVLPTSTAKQLTTPGTLTSEYELEPEHATYDAAARTWVVPGRKGVCLVMSVPDDSVVDAGCGSLASADSGGLIMIRRSAAGPVIYGFAPTGMAVTITNKDGSTINPPVTNDVFMYSDTTASSVAVHVGGKTTPIYQAP